MAAFVKSFSKAGKYGHAVGRIMVHEATLLKWQQVHRLIESEFNEALAVTLETVYGPYLEGATVPDEIESGLMRFLADEYRFIDEVCAGTLAAELMHTKYDFHNLRVLLKQHYFGDSGEDKLLSELGTVDIEGLRSCVEEQSGGVPGHLRKVVDEVRRRLERGPPDSQLLDTMIDRAFLERRLEVAEMEDSGLLVDFARAAVDVANLRVLLRGLGLDKDKEYYYDALAEGGKLSRRDLLELSGEPFDSLVDKLLKSRYGQMLTDVLQRGEDRARLTSLDKASDDYLLGELRRFTLVSMGPERIVRFMMTRENEVAMLRIILMGKLHALSPEVIEARLPLAHLRWGAE
jgi:V/A-type H+-transporting ATPase subunit C